MFFFFKTLGSARWTAKNKGIAMSGEREGEVTQEVGVGAVETIVMVVSVSGETVIAVVRPSVRGKDGVINLLSRRRR
jgi:hypothetical protein